jgi:hypothetical protein
MTTVHAGRPVSPAQRRWLEALADAGPTWRTPPSTATSRVLIRRGWVSRHQDDDGIARDHVTAAGRAALDSG